VPFVEVQIRSSKIKRNTQHGVEVHGSLLVRNSTVAKNHRSGFSLQGPATIWASTIAKNHAGGWIGCGRSETDVVIDGTEFSDNAPNGGLYVACGDVSIVRSKFVRNHDALEGGGALYAAESAAVEIHDTTFRKNRAKGSAGRVTGGAILSLGEMSLAGVTVNANKASGKGGGIHNTGSLDIANSTLSGNVTARRGGGLAASSLGTVPSTSLRHVTITDNTAAGTAGGLSATGGGELEVFGSIMAENFGGGQPDVDVSGTVSMISSYNVYGDCCDYTWSATDLTDVADPRLGPLADNGGPAKTHALLEGSPAVDLIPGSACSMSLDQRNTTRPQGGRCDSGSFELIAVGGASLV